MSKRKKVFEFISGQKSGKDGWVRMTNRMLSEQLEMTVQEIQQIVGSLKNTGNIETLIEDGKVAAYRIVKAPSMWRRVTGKRRGFRKQSQEQATASETRQQRDNIIHLLRTPNIDRYASAKETFEKMISSEAVKEYVTAEWREDPTAEEGLTLKAQLLAARTRLSELQEKYAVEHRELEYFRKTRDEQFRETLSKAGVVHAGQRVVTEAAPM